MWKGCTCQDFTYGCCGDEKTPAPGPNGEGCTCEHSKYGCCLDGVTEALGDKFEGCAEIPDIGGGTFSVYMFSIRLLVIGFWYF